MCTITVNMGRLRRAAPTTLFVRNRSARRACERYYLETFKSNLGAPATEVGSRIVKRITKFDEHVQRHEQSKYIFSTSIINEGFNRNQCATRWKSVVRLPNQMHLLLEVPIVKDHSHRNDVSFGERV